VVAGRARSRRPLLAAVGIAGALALLPAATVAASAGGAPPPPGAVDIVPATDAGLDPAGLEALDRAMRKLVTDGRRAGVVYGVMRRGRLVALRAHGSRNLERGLPMTTDTLFRLYSQSRAVTAAAILTLVDEGRMALGDPVAKYLPEIGRMPVIAQLSRGRVVATVPQRRPMTLRDLFTYTSGLGYAADWPRGAGIDQREMLDLSGTLADMTARLARYPLLYQPGERWVYGFHSDVLGRVAEVASGQPFDEFLEQRLLEPLGMHDTGFHVRAGGADRLAEVYGPDASGKLAPRPAVPSSRYTARGTFFSAGGGLVSSVPDYLRFGQMLLERGTLAGRRVLQPQTVDAMTRNALTAEQGGEVNWYRYGQEDLFRGYGWGLGIGVRLPGRVHTVPGSDGDLAWGGLASTQYFIDPTEQIVAVAMSQYLGPDLNEIGFVLREGVYASIPGRR
jgi:CubicO group peptidase (beta-lactamase class C family)